MWVFKKDGLRLAAFNLWTIFGFTSELQFGLHCGFSAVFPDTEGYIEVVFGDQDVIHDTILDALFGGEFGFQNWAGFELAVDVEGCCEETVFGVLAMGATVEVTGFGDGEGVSVFLGMEVRWAYTEDVGFMMVFQSSLEQGSNSPLNIKRVLSIPSFGADDILDVSIVEINLDGFVQVGDGSMLLAVSSNNLHILQAQNLVALGLLRQQNRGFELRLRLLAFSS